MHDGSTSTTQRIETASDVSMRCARPIISSHFDAKAPFWIPSPSTSLFMRWPARQLLPGKRLWHTPLRTALLGQAAMQLCWSVCTCLLLAAVALLWRSCEACLSRHDAWISLQQLMQSLVKQDAQRTHEHKAIDLVPNKALCPLNHCCSAINETACAGVSQLADDQYAAVNNALPKTHALRAVCSTIIYCSALRCCLASLIWSGRRLICFEHNIPPSTTASFTHVCPLCGLIGS